MAKSLRGEPAGVVGHQPLSKGVLKSRKIWGKGKEREKRFAPKTSWSQCESRRSRKGKGKEWWNGGGVVWRGQ